MADAAQMEVVPTATDSAAENTSTADVDQGSQNAKLTFPGDEVISFFSNLVYIYLVI